MTPAARAPAAMNLYLHVPFCLSKCRYCALYSIAGLEGARDFPRRIGRECALRAGGHLAPGTIYFGGGTPGLLGSDGLRETVAELAAAGIDISRATEWTVELNPSPEITTPALLDALRALGVNRLSFGAQSLDDAVLKAMGRRHTARDVADALALARAHGFGNVGFDLIAGYPGVEAPAWEKTLAKALALAPRHLSVYGLIVESGTALGRDIAAGRLAPLADDAQMDLLARTEDILAAAGFVRYEISNYALPGFECRHNLACWRGEDYLGLGPAAASRLGLTRRTIAPDVAKWRAALGAGSLPPAENDETLSPADDAEERFAYALRMAEGASPAAFAKTHPAAAVRVAEWESTLRRLATHGITQEIRPGRWALTRRGREVADAAIAELLA